MTELFVTVEKWGPSVTALQKVTLFLFRCPIFSAPRRSSHLQSLTPTTITSALCQWILFSSRKPHKLAIRPRLPGDHEYLASTSGLGAPSATLPVAVKPASVLSHMPKAAKNEQQRHSSKEVIGAFSTDFPWLQYHSPEMLSNVEFTRNGCLVPVVCQIESDSRAQQQRTLRVQCSFVTTTTP